MNIAEILKELRIESGLTQTRLSEELGIGQTTVAAYESGAREPHVSSLIAYADYFNCSMDYLTGRTDDGREGCADFSKEEVKILRVYRELNPDLQVILLNFANTLKKSDINKK